MAPILLNALITPVSPGGAMIKALFVMIVLSNDYAARLVNRLQRQPG